MSAKGGSVFTFNLAGRAAFPLTPLVMTLETPLVTTLEIAIDVLVLLWSLVQREISLKVKV